MSGRIPEPFIDAVLQRTNIVELIDSLVPLKKRGHNYLACCPFHNEKTPSFNVVPKKQFYHCFGCGASGNAIGFLMAFSRLEFPEAVEQLAHRAQLEMPQTEQSYVKTAAPKSLHKLLSEVDKLYQQTLKQEAAAIAYLKSRGIDGQTAKNFHVGYAPSDWHFLERRLPSAKQGLIDTGMLIEKDDGKVYCRYRDRITFPIHNRKGEIVGFGGRAILPEQTPKYLNSPETVLFQKNRELYGLYQVLEKQENPVYIVLVEGYLDVISMHQKGFPIAVAALGTAVNSFHLQIIAKYTNEVLFCLDGDRAGRDATWRAIEQYLPKMDTELAIRIVQLPDGEDPDSCIQKLGKDGFQKYLDDALPLSEYLLMKYAEGLNLSQSSGKAQLLQKGEQLLKTVPSSAFKELFMIALSRRTGVSIDRIARFKTSEKTSESKPKTNIRRTPIRLAIALLLQHPELYESHQAPLQRLLENTNIEVLFRELIEHVSQHQGTNTGRILEAFREHGAIQALMNIAGWDHQTPLDCIHQEFTDVLHHLERQALHQEIETLLEASRQADLSYLDKARLQALLMRRHQLNPR